MPTDDNIWLSLHCLSNALADVGLTREDRIAVALARFEKLPLVVQRELHTELQSLATDLLAILPQMNAALSAANSPVARGTA
jgi:hypothetical protein